MILKLPAISKYIAFRTQTTLENHFELCGYNNFCSLEVPKEGKTVIRYKPGSRSLKINSVIYIADFECILMPYSGYDKENVTTKKLDKHVPCGYSINVVSNHNKVTKQTVYRGKGTVSTFCKELRKIAQGILNTEVKSMYPLSKKEQKAYIMQSIVIYVKKCGVNIRIIKKNVIMIIIQVN